MTPTRMATARTVAALRAHVSAWREGRGATVALVPTMGALHAGHLSLVKLARAQADRVVVSIFVNPPPVRRGRRPGALPAPGAGRRPGAAGGGLRPAVRARRQRHVSPLGFSTSIDVAGVSGPLEGGARAGHFAGVATVVAKLLLQARPDMAVFGEKDWQQLQVIRRLVRDLDLQVDVLGAPIARDADGLALSSRNAFLIEAERALAPRLHALLMQAAAALAKGAPVARVEATGRQALIDKGFAAVDYLEVREPETLAPVDPGPLTAPARLLAAARLGGVRLLDNLAVAPAKP